MPFVQKRLINPTTLTTSASSALYTVPAGFSTVIKQLVVTNTTGSAATFTFYIGDAVAGNALFSATSVAANDTVIINLSQVLQSNEVLRALASANSTLNLTVSGVENDGPLEPSANFIANDSVTVNKIADGSVTSAKIADLNVTTSKIANNSVTQGKLTSSLSGMTVTTSSLLSTAVPTPFEGQMVFLTDTDRMLLWTGAAWVIPNQTTQNPEGLELVTSVEVPSVAVAQLQVFNCFSDTYNAYRIIWSGGTMSAGAGPQAVRLYLGSTPTAIHSQTLMYSTYASTGYNQAINNSNNFWNWIGHGDEFSAFAYIDLFHPFQSQRTRMVSNGYVTNTAGGATWGVTTNANSFSGFTLTPESNNMRNGTVSVYGYRK